MSVNPATGKYDKKQKKCQINIEELRNYKFYKYLELRDVDIIEFIYNENINKGQSGRTGSVGVFPAEATVYFKNSKKKMKKKRTFLDKIHNGILSKEEAELPIKIIEKLNLQSLLKIINEDDHNKIMKIKNDWDKIFDNRFLTFNDRFTLFEKMISPDFRNLFPKIIFKDFAIIIECLYENIMLSLFAFFEEQENTKSILTLSEEKIINGLKSLGIEPDINEFYSRNNYIKLKEKINNLYNLRCDVLAHYNHKKIDESKKQLYDFINKDNGLETMRECRDFIVKYTQFIYSVLDNNGLSVRNSNVGNSLEFMIKNHFKFEKDRLSKLRSTLTPPEKV